MNSIFFEIHTREELYPAQTVQRLIHEIVNVGYFLVAESESSAAFTARWGIIHPDWHGWRNLSAEKARDLAQEQASAPELARSMTAGASPQLQVEIERFCTHRLDKLAVNAYAIHRDGPMRGFEFGPEMVQKLGGREYVLAAPAHIVRPLDDGGVLLIPEMNLYPGVLQFDWETAADYLGLTCPDFS